MGSAIFSLSSSYSQLVCLVSPCSHVPGCDVLVCGVRGPLHSLNMAQKTVRARAQAYASL